MDKVLCLSNKQQTDSWIYGLRYIHHHAQSLLPAYTIDLPSAMLRSAIMPIDKHEWPVLIVSGEFDAATDEGCRLRELKKQLTEI